MCLISFTRKHINIFQLARTCELLQSGIKHILTEAPVDLVVPAKAQSFIAVEKRISQFCRGKVARQKTCEIGIKRETPTTTFFQGVSSITINFLTKSRQIYEATSR